LTRMVSYVCSQIEQRRMDSLAFAGDETGDVSFKFDKGASRYFVVAIIATAHPHELRAALEALRIKYNLPQRYEFRFHRTTASRLRTALFNTLRDLDYRIWAVVTDKTELPDAFRVMHPRDFYVYFVTEAIRLIPEDERKKGYLTLDQFDEAGHTITALKRGLAHRGIPRGFKQMRAKRSHSDDLIQIADLAAGTLLRLYTRGDDTAYRILQAKFVKLLEYCPGA